MKENCEMVDTTIKQNYYSGCLLNPSKSPITIIERAHERLSQHVFNTRFVLYQSANKDVTQHLEVSQDILFVRPATLKEVLIVEPNVVNLEPRNDVMCPCVVFVKGVFYIAIPPVMQGIPTFGEWLNSQGKCELCGININHNNTGYCCDIHMNMRDIFSLDFLISGVVHKASDLKKGLYDVCKVCDKESNLGRACKCGKSYCSRSCQRLDKKKHIKICNVRHTK